MPRVMRNVELSVRFISTATGYLQYDCTSLFYLLVLCVVEKVEKAGLLIKDP